MAWLNYNVLYLSVGTLKPVVLGPLNRSHKFGTFLKGLC